MSIGKRHRLHILGPRTKLFLNPAGAVEPLILIVSAPAHAVGWQEGGSRACEVSEMSLAVKAGTAKSGAQRMPAQVSKHCDDNEPTTARTTGTTTTSPTTTTTTSKRPPRHHHETAKLLSPKYFISGFRIMQRQGFPSVLVRRHAVFHKVKVTMDPASVHHRDPAQIIESKNKICSASRRKPRVGERVRLR